MPNVRYYSRDSSGLWLLFETATKIDDTNDCTMTNKNMNELGMSSLATHLILRNYERYDDS